LILSIGIGASCSLIRLNRLEQDVPRGWTPPVFDGGDFSCWKICTKAYLEAIDVGVYRATAQGFPKPKDLANLINDEVHYEKWNAKARNALFRGLCKESLTMCGTIKTPMNYGRTYVHSMREPSVSVRNAITL
jgi:hypothetical protein